MTGSSRQVEALLELVDQYRSTHCARVEEAARVAAETLLRQARAAARERVARALAEERKRAGREVASAEARRRTRERLREQRRRARQLHEAWQLLPDALARRWSERETRGRWTASAARRALEVLAPHDWRIAHPPGWSEAERSQVLKLVSGRLDSPPAFVADENIRAGLRIYAGDTVLDATLEGILADRAAVEARLLYYLAKNEP